MTGHLPSDYADAARRMKEAPQGFTIIKQAVGFHSTMAEEVPGFYFGEPREGRPRTRRGMVTERGLHHLVDCVRAMKEVLGDGVGLALDCGPGWTVPDAIRLARAVEELHVLWLEDLVGGDYTPYQMAAEFREVTRATSVPTHTGEQVYLRQNFIELIEQHAVRIVGPDPADVGGIAELKWIGEFADLHGSPDRAPRRRSTGCWAWPRTCAGRGDDALQLHRVRVPPGEPGLVVRDRGRASRTRSSKNGSIEGLGPAGDGRRSGSRVVLPLPGGGGPHVLRPAGDPALGPRLRVEGPRPGRLVHQPPSLSGESG